MLNKNVSASKVEFLKKVQLFYFLSDASVYFTYYCICDQYLVQLKMMLLTINRRKLRSCAPCKASQVKKKIIESFVSVQFLFYILIKVCGGNRVLSLDIGNPFPPIFSFCKSFVPFFQPGKFSGFPSKKIM